jgi:pimeloyl-ACP methyl ester carboxylesterase
MVYHLHDRVPLDVRARRVIEPLVAVVAVGEATLATATWGEGQPEIVLLHDGLGSIAQWRSVPAGVAQRCGRTVLAYDRPGHGRSTPVPVGAWPTRWLHDEAERLALLLEVCGIDRPILVGHSDGGSIALIHAATTDATAGVVALAAHSWVEQITVDRIAALRARPEPVIAGLRDHHADPAAVFEAWSGVWTSDEFRRWDIRPQLAAVDVPVVVAQGDTDEYATDAQAIETAAAIGDNASCVLLPRLGHLLHHHDPDLVADVVADFADTIDR